MLVGLGRYRERAVCSATRWTSRLVLTLLAVAAGFGVDGAILGAVASTGLEAAVARGYVRPRLRLAPPAGLGRRLWRFSAPLFLHSVSLQLFHRMGLLALVPLGVPVGAAGVYGAADSLLRLRRVLGQSLTPLVLSALTQLQREGRSGEARALGSAAGRCALLALVPVAAIAGAASPLMAWIFGGGFAGGGVLLELLIWSAPAFLLLSVSSAILISRERPGGTAALTAPLVPCALAGYLAAVPRWGTAGAAAVTSGSAIAVALAAAILARRAGGGAPPLATLLRAAAAAGAAYGVARALPWEGFGLLARLPLAALAGGATLLVLGEASLGELGALRAWIAARRAVEPARRVAGSLEDAG
jgi:O-antigen/teichoic acid export membrane protein